MEPIRRKRKGSDNRNTGQSPVQPSSVHGAPSGAAPLVQLAPPTVRLNQPKAEVKATGPRSQSPQSETPRDDVPKTVHATLSSPGQPIDAEMRRRLESRTGHDLSQVRVHADKQAAISARALDARAYTVGSHIVFGEGEYAPKTTEGQRLLAHETAHVLHQTEAGVARSGISPPDSIGEQRADEFAASFAMPSLAPAGRKAPSFREWGDAWRIHRQPTITRRGTVAHTGAVGAPAPGQTGVSIGTVEVRRGDDLEEGGVALPNRMALEYGGALANVTKWLQFVWFEMIATTPAGARRSSGSLTTSSGFKPYTTNPQTPNWSVDAATTANPFYEAGFRNIRTAGGTTVFDAPGGASWTSEANAAYTANPTATVVTFIAHFETYLIQNNVAAYRVCWSGTTVYTRAAGVTTASAIAYAVLPGTGAVTAVPASLITILQSSYSSFPGVRNIR